MPPLVTGVVILVGCRPFSKRKRNLIFENSMSQVAFTGEGLGQGIRHRVTLKNVGEGKGDRGQGTTPGRICPLPPRRVGFYGPGEGLLPNTKDHDTRTNTEDQDMPVFTKDAAHAKVVIGGLGRELPAPPPKTRPQQEEEVAPP